LAFRRDGFRTGDIFAVRLAPAVAGATVAISKEFFKAEVADWAKKMDVEPKEVRVRPMTTKWGSCSTAGRANFDLGLLKQPADFRKEIIVYELLHLKVPNHGKLFKALLKAYLAKSAFA